MVCHVTGPVYGTMTYETQFNSQPSCLIALQAAKLWILRLLLSSGLRANALFCFDVDSSKLDGRQPVSFVQAILKLYGETYLEELF